MKRRNKTERAINTLKAMRYWIGNPRDGRDVFLGWDWVWLNSQYWCW